MLSRLTHIQASISRIRSTGMGSFSGRLDPSTRDTIVMMSKRATERCTGLMAPSIEASGSRASNTAWAS